MILLCLVLSVAVLGVLFSPVALLFIPVLARTLLIFFVSIYCVICLSPTRWFANSLTEKNQLVNLFTDSMSQTCET